MSEDKQLWQQMIDNYNIIEGKLPVFYYRPFRIAMFYLEHKLPNTILDDFKDRFFGAEQYYNYVKNEELYEKDERNVHFKGILNKRLVIFPVPYVVYENMFMIHYTVEHRKIGFNLFFEKDYVWKSNPVRITKLAEIHSKMMRLDGWELLDISWDKYVSLGKQEARDKYIEDWYNQATEIQKEKGIIKPFKQVMV